MRCIEFGANIDNQDVVEHTFNYTDHLHVLFLGVDWVRKGGEIAVKTCRLLNGNGIKTTLHVVGIKNLDISGFIETEPILIAPAELVKKFDTFCQLVFSKVYANALESEQLALVRDTLLPKLMSGEIDVNDIRL